MIPLLLLSARTLPVIRAYSEPDPLAVDVSAPVGAIPKGQRLVWYVRPEGPGELAAALVPPQPRARVRVRKARDGWRRIEAEGTLDAPLTGVALSGAPFAWSDQTHRGAASVHLRFPQADGSEWVYHEAVARTDPLWTYYCAIGWHRGYFGFQVNSPTERRLIFSVWDAGDEATDRAKVGDENRVRLLEKGPGVVAESFGNEGTGGHSHLVYPWKRGQRMRFAVHARPDGDGTVYTGWFFFPERRRWGIVARMRAPKDGSLLRGIYCFDEDFSGANGQTLRAADFGPMWSRVPGGEWREATRARFTQDALSRGRRDDIGLEVLPGAFRLWSGGYVRGTARYGDERERRPTKRGGWAVGPLGEGA